MSRDLGRAVGVGAVRGREGQRAVQVRAGHRPEAAERVARAQVDPATGRKQAIPDALEKPRWFSGGGGMVSTATDYARFCQMLLNGGRLDEAQIVARRTLALMTADHLPPGTQYGPDLFSLFGGLAPAPSTGYGFGLGFAVRTAEGRSPATPHA